MSKSSPSKPETTCQEVNTWDSDVEFSSDDNQNENDKKQNEKQEQSASKLKPPSTPAPPPNANNTQNRQNTENTKEVIKKDDPSHLKLSLFDHYNQSKVYSNLIKKRRIQKKTNNNDNDDFDDTDDDKEQQPLIERTKQKVTINDLKSNRILYEMNNYQYKWFWIDSLPTDDNNDYIWIQQYSNINLFQQQQQQGMI